MNEELQILDNRMNELLKEMNTLNPASTRYVGLSLELERVKAEYDDKFIENCDFSDSEIINNTAG